MTPRQRFCFAGVVTALVLAAAVASCWSCASHIPPAARGRTAPQMHHSTVTIRTFCGGKFHGGSGVVVSPNRVLTAAHVVTCENADGIKSQASDVRVNPGDGQWRPAKIVAYAMTPDVAALVVEGIDRYGDIPVTLGPIPGLGERVCASTGSMPRYAIKCGFVQPRDDQEEAGDIEMDATIEPGNSGSGLYDASGRLVGIVVHFRRCINGQICGGAATSVWSRKTLLGI